MSEPIRTPNENPSRVEGILSDTIGLPGYEIEPPRSRVETLLISLDGSIAANVVASIDPSTYVLTLTLKDKNDGTIGTPSTVDLPLEATVIGGRYDSQTKKLILTLTSGNTIEIPLSDLIYGLQNEITSENPLDADLVDDTSSDHKFVSTSEKTAWNGKQDVIDSNHKLDADLVDDSSSINKFNVQANWTESNSSSPSFIQNKPTIPSAGSSDPLMDGTASAGTASTYSKSDHVHPTDTSRQAVINSNNKLSADLIDDTNSTNKFATAAQLQQIETNKTNILAKQDALVVGTNLDNTPTQNSTNPITSGGVYSTVGNIDSALSGLIMSLEPKTITANGTYNPEDDGVDGYNMVTVNVGGSVAEKDVNFFDYDGSIVASYTAAEFADLTAMPNNPTHEGLTAQGWNWSLSDAKTYVASYGKLNVCQTYITSDGKTRLYIRLSEGRLKPYLGLTGGSSGTAVSIDWGDNSNTESVTLNTSTVYTPHGYATAGDYVIAITVTNGSISFSGDTAFYSNIFRKSATRNSTGDEVYRNILTKLEIGSGITSIGYSALYRCYSLTSITIPNGVTSINAYAFCDCYALTFVTIPSSITSIGQYTFNGCYSLTSITIPNGVTTISQYAFMSCRALTSITIPSSVTSIGQYTFGGCYSLASITIPNGVTSIDSNAFDDCYSLTSITIPSSVTSIGRYGNNYTFNNCYGLGFIKFERSTPPTVSNSNAWSNISTDCIIYVPTGSLSAYTSADNYPSSSTYTYVEY